VKLCKFEYCRLIGNYIKMKYSFLFDNSVYRPLVRSGNGVALENFNLSISNHKILNKISYEHINYSLTPFSIMEALGIVIPDPKIKLPKEISTEKTYDKAFNFIKKEAEKYYSNLNLITQDKLLQKAKEQSEFTSFQAKSIEKIFIQNPLEIESFFEYFIQSLVFDYVCKYEFPGEIQKIVFNEILIPTFFMNENVTSRFSKFRIVKRLWDNSYHGLEKSTKFPKGYIKSLNDSMKLKRNKDFLDCEIIHFSCIGDCVEGKFNTVFSFTQDEKSIVVNRIIVYKSMINLFLNHVSDEYYNHKKVIINDWRQGMIIFCNKEGSFIDSIDVSNIETIKY
jgi:hypothetical protein